MEVHFVLMMQKTFSSSRRLVFALFAACVLFAMLREWNAPVACLRPFRQPAASSKLP
jgi:hypothetical protein